MLGKTRANMVTWTGNVARTEDKEHAYIYKILSGNL